MSPSFDQVFSPLFLLSLYCNQFPALSQQIGVMLCDHLRRNSAFCVVLRVHAKRDVEWWRALTQCVVLCGGARSHIGS